MMLFCIATYAGLYVLSLFPMQKTDGNGSKLCPAKARVSKDTGNRTGILLVVNTVHCREGALSKYLDQLEQFVDERCSLYFKDIQPKVVKVHANIYTSNCQAVSFLLTGTFLLDQYIQVTIFIAILLYAYSTSKKSTRPEQRDG